MRIIRFRAPDGVVRAGLARGAGTARLLDDPRGVLGRSSPAACHGFLEGCRAIVADDDPNMAAMMTAVLRRAGCECASCTSGREALQHIDDDGAVDLVVSDIAMPEADGYEIFAAAKARRSDLPVVLVTGFGYDPTHSLLRASAQGLDSVVYKPFAPQRLLEEVDRAMLACASAPQSLLHPSEREERIETIEVPIRPVNLIGIGRNFGAGGEPLLEDLEVFVKPTTAVVGPGATIPATGLPGGDAHVIAEAELALVVGLPARRVPREHALGRVLGVTAALDLTALRFQTERGAPIWMRGKGFDGFCPLGPQIATLDELPPLDELEIRTFVNGTLQRRARVGDMLRGPADIVAGLSEGCTLVPGTVIITGGPPLVDGIAFPPPPLRAGDEVRAEIDGLPPLVVQIG